MKVLFLPLDSRPCTYDLPFEIGKMGGLDVLRPPLSLMDDYRKPGNYCEISSWILDNVKECEYAIISIDQLLYGGLISSREQTIDLETALARFDVLTQIRKINPEIGIYCTNTIMRTTISTLKKEDEIYWQKVADYAKATSSDPNLAEKIRREIPEEIITKFLNSRERNHKVNLEAIRLLGEGIIDILVFLQEDSSPEGMHKKEQKILLDRAKENKTSHRLFMMNGTDETASCLMGYLINREPKDICVHSIRPYNDFVALFEDRPFSENLNKYFELCNFRQSEAEDTDCVLSIYLPEGGQGDYCGSSLSKEDDEDDLNRYINEIREYIQNGKRVYLLDLYDANGGNYRLIRQLYDSGLLERLSGYSGWNTASNSLGTLLGEICCGSHSRKLLYYHILDDMFYQSIVRTRLQNQLSDMEIDYWKLDDHIDESQRLLNEFMHEEVNRLDNRHIFPGFDAELRWARTFECHIDILEKC